MQCPQCQAENPDQAKFCLECGAKLQAVCPECGAALPPAAKFCFECGAKVGVPAAPPPPPSMAPAATRRWMASAKRMPVSTGSSGSTAAMARRMGASSM